MQKRDHYPKTRFATSVLEEAVQKFIGSLPEDTGSVDLNSLEVQSSNTEWTFDSLDEFFHAHRSNHSTATLTLYARGVKYSLRISELWSDTTITVGGPDRASILPISSIFERYAEDSRIASDEVPSPSSPTIFIGHGGSPQWRDLKDHLQDKQGYKVVAYETGARAGHVIRDILEEMVRASSFAVLIMTGEDKGVDGDLRTRQNVIHETGLFQGTLGFTRAIVLLEDGVTNYSNLDGVQYVPFPKGLIQSTFGEVLATLRREFGPN